MGDRKFGVGNWQWVLLTRTATSGIINKYFLNSRDLVRSCIKEFVVKN
jgi:hypothetical protein